MSHRNQFFFIAILSIPLSALAQTGEVPRRVGECANTTIKSVETRLSDFETKQPIPGSGSAVTFENGEYQVSYDTVPAIEQSKVGDPIRMCLVSVPSNCPKGDYRGREYRTTNLRTRQSWTLTNSQHMCGGA
jgi:hypothetical protein